MTERTILPKVVFICHENDRLDMEGLGAWLASSFNLVGMVVLRDRPGSRWQKLRREYRRVGFLRVLDILLFRAFYVIRHGYADGNWREAEIARLREKYPRSPETVSRLISDDPNSEEVRHFVEELQPDMTIARCKFILKPEVFNIPCYGTYVLHPGICPEYRNAHGCFWALVNGDLDSVGMTLLKVDEGVDTGPVYLQTSYSFDEEHESHLVIQYRVVVENLDRVALTLYGICWGSVRPLQHTGQRRSETWGQPWLTAYIQWKRSARRRRVTA